MGSPAFTTGFLGPERTQTPTMHGPFQRASVTQSDFQLLTREQFQGEIAALRKVEWFNHGSTDEQWEQVLIVIAEIYVRSTWFLKLRLNEDDNDYFHETGWLHAFFREFICAAPQSEIVDRLVFGFD